MTWFLLKDVEVAQMKSWQEKALMALGILVLGCFLFWLTCLNHTSLNHIGVAYDSLNGNVTIQDQPGWYVTSPFVLVGYISTLPTKVTIPSTAVVIVAKVVRFRPEGVSEFIRLQGFKYWNSGEVSTILLGYAFSGGKYPFLEIIQEANQENTANLRPLNPK